jgi:hypothetical protein
MAHYPKIFDSVGAGTGEGTLSGQNYVVVETVNTGPGNSAADAITNGLALRAGLIQLNSLNWGYRSITNMGSLLLMPGTYNLGSATITMIDYINIIGLSTNRRDTIITASSMSTASGSGQV